ncbi:Splicing factor [Histomonas meleagridis]|uniref:Splicing factor n=1 Tax=Histomonas meleagridis TaxID=135588 RepID=UPI003559B5F8|nr:Splicing factor [Histomonas meleagridis]KAH0806532.1 Splicing factor [Histomonas meleagridis]
MYRQYKAFPEFNRICMKASRDRAYQRHIDALRKIRSSIDTNKPSSPQAYRRYKSHENEKRRNSDVTRSRDIERDEHHSPKNDSIRIARENHRLLAAVQDKKPLLDRNDWYLHQLDHMYQTTKMSEFKKTVPISEIQRQRMSRTRPATTYNGPRSRYPPLSTSYGQRTHTAKYYDEDYSSSDEEEHMPPPRRRTQKIASSSSSSDSEFEHKKHQNKTEATPKLEHVGLAAKKKEEPQTQKLSIHHHKPPKETVNKQSPRQKKKEIKSSSSSSSSSTDQSDSD